MLRERLPRFKTMGGLFALGGSIMTIGCHLNQSADLAPLGVADEQQPTATQSASAGMACATYVREVCAGAGEDTATCAGFRSAVELMSERTCSVGLDDLAQSLKKLVTIRKPCSQLRDELCASFGGGSELCDFVTVQTRLFPVEQCTTMLGSLPNVVEDLKQLHAAKKPLTEDLAAAIAAGQGPGFGPPQAPIDVVVFSDFECPYCAQAASVVQAIRERYADKVHFVFRQFPLPSHPNAELAARASLAAHAQGRFWEFHDRAFSNEGPLDRSALERIASDVGLDSARFTSMLADPSLEQTVEYDILLGKQIEVAGTPALYVNGRRIEHPTDLTSVINAIERVQRDHT